MHLLAGTLDNIDDRREFLQGTRADRVVSLWGKPETNRKPYLVNRLGGRVYWRTDSVIQDLVGGAVGVILARDNALLQFLRGDAERSRIV